MKPVLSVSANPVKCGRYVFSSEGWGVGVSGVISQSQVQLAGRELFVVTPDSFSMELDQFSQIPQRRSWSRSKLSFPSAG